MKKSYRNPCAELILIMNEDICTVSLSDGDDGVKAPSGWFPQPDYFA